MEGKATFCDTCKDIAFLIDDYYKYRQAKFDRENGLFFRPKELEFKGEEISLGTLKDLQICIECTSCQDIARTTRSLLHDEKERPARVVLKFTACVWNQSLYMDVCGASSLEEKLKLFRLGNADKAHEVGRLFDPRHVNVELLRQWVYCCHTSHNDHCPRIEIPIHLSLIYLIDVMEGCLISANMETKYVALSYVWGNFRTFQTTKTNLAYLQRPGSIGVRGNNLKIGKTIEDALRLVSLLGERYLWVDCLCIVQDDLNTKQESLNAMGSIYANAYLTIVAADGHHADHGLRGLGHGSQNRSVGCNIIRFPFETDVVTHRSRAWYPEDSPWESRAWTFQEALFSRRLLIFNGTVSWFCRDAIWEEHVKEPTEDVAYASVANPATSVPFAARAPTRPDIDRWTDLVENFNARKLTFDEDVMDASAGLTSIFDSHFSGGILWGLPEMFFDHCIIWRPWKVLRRRRAYKHALLAELFPSWSWVAWEGDLVFSTSPTLYNEPESDSQKVQIHPLAQWYKSTEPTSSFYPIQNIDHALRLQRVKLEAEQVPTGWSQGQYPDGTLFFTHETVPNERFRYPIPLKNESTRPSINEHGRYLHYKTQKTRLFLGREIVDDRPNRTTCTACLSDSEGNWAGIIHLNKSRNESLPREQHFDLIALSLAEADNSSKYVLCLDEWDIPERPRDSEFYHFYYVMWVEWNAGIAYRKAIGTVHKPVWDRQVRLDIDVILG